MTNLILQGATAQPQTLAQASAFDSLTGVKQNVVQMFWSMQDGYRTDGSPRYTDFPVSFAEALWQKKQLYLHTWAPSDWRSKVGWTPDDIVGGKYDAYFNIQAGLLKNWAHPVFIRLMHEMNGWWTYYGPPNPPAKPVGWTPADFVRVWRYIVGYFKASGCSNITWVWCPNGLSPVGSVPATAADKLAAYYPGDDVVDWTGFDAYNWGAPKSTQWLSFNTICRGSLATQSWIGDTYGTVAKIAPDKPMMLAEFGCHNIGGNRVDWITDALAAVVQLPLIRCINYYNVDNGTPGSTWPLLITDGTALAWAAGVRAGPYPQTGTYLMPPDMQPIKPMVRLDSWGDQVAPLQVQLAECSTNLDNSREMNRIGGLALEELQNTLQLERDAHQVDLYKLSAIRDALKTLAGAAAEI